MLENDNDKQSELASIENDRKTQKLSFIIPVLIFLTGTAISLSCGSFFHIAQFKANEVARQSAELEVSNYVIGEIESYERTVRIISSLIEVSDLENISELQNRIVFNIPEVSLFDRIVMLIRTDNSWKVKDLTTPSSDGLDYYPNWGKVSYKNLASYMLENDMQHSMSVQMFSNVPGTRYWQQSNDPLMRAKPFAIVQKISNNKNQDVIVVGLTRMTKILDIQWVSEHKNISDLVISHYANSEVLFQLDRRTHNEMNIDEILKMKPHHFKVGNQEIALHLIFKNLVAGPISYIPIAISILGTVMSFLMAIFYSSSVKKNRKLKKLSSSYVQKNYELNIELAERERLNNLLFSAEREFRILVDSVSDIVLEISPQSEIIFANKAWEKITGFTVERSINHPLFDFIHGSDTEELRENFKQVFRGQKFSHHSRLKLKTEEGRYKLVQLSISSIRQEGKGQPRLIMTIMDIEAQQRTKQALNEAEKKYRNIIENAAGGFYQVTLDGQILSANPSLLHILGYESEEMMRQHVMNLFDVLFGMSAEKYKFLKELEVHNSVKNFENKAKTADKSEIWINQNARTVKDDNGNILYIEGSIENVNQRKEFEQKLKEAKIESDLANRAKSEFLANMSHELRTPLNAIIGFSEIIKDEVLGPVQNKQYWEYASDIYKSGKSLLKIINEILDVSRIETGERQLNESNVDLDTVVSSCFDFAKNRMEETSQLTITNMSEGKLPHVVGEELAIKQIFLNILSNAIKFTPAGGRITFSHEIITTGDLRISITDTGIGLNETEIEKALSPFGQIDTAMSREGSGAGLGLNLVNSLISLHDGRLEIFSQKGVGTTVTVTLPSKRILHEEDTTSSASGSSSLIASNQTANVSQEDVASDEPQADVFADEPQADVFADEPQADVFADEPQADVSIDEPQADVSVDETQAYVSVDETQADVSADETQADVSADNEDDVKQASKAEGVGSKYTRQAEQLSDEDRQKADVFESFFKDDDDEDGTSPTIQ